MTDETQVLLGLISSKSTVKIVAGFFHGFDGARATVEFDNGWVPAYTTSAYRPEVNDPVWVVIVDSVAYMLGPTVPKPASGVVVSTDSGLVTLTTDAGPVVATYPLGASLSAGQVVKLFWSDGCHVISVLSTSAAPVVPSPPPGGSGPSVKTGTFTAVDSGSFGSSWWTGQVWSSPSNVGAWFYGTKIADTIPAAAVVSRVQVFISAVQIKYEAANWALHSAPTRSGGAPSFGGTTPVAPAPGWIDLPASYGDALKAGGGSFGIGVVHGGYHKFRSVGEDPMSGALRITYTA